MFRTAYRKRNKPLEESWEAQQQPRLKLLLLLLKLLLLLRHLPRLKQKLLQLQKHLLSRKALLLLLHRLHRPHASVAAFLAESDPRLGVSATLRLEWAESLER